MSKLPFANIGDVVRIDDRAYTMLGRGPKGILMFKCDDARHIYRSPEQIMDLIEARRFRVITPATQSSDGSSDPSDFDLGAYPAKIQKAVVDRLKYMKAIKEHQDKGGKLTAASIDPIMARVHRAICDNNRLSDGLESSKPMAFSTAMRWFQRWMICGCNVVALLSQTGGNRSDRLAPAVREMLTQVIHDHYLTPRRLNIGQVQSRLETLINVDNARRKQNREELLRVPSYEVIRRSIGRLDPYLVDSSRYSPEYAHKKWRTYGAARPTDRHLERVQIDHTQLDIRVQIGPHILFRPWLTLAVDVHTKAILGYHIDDAGPNAASVMSCLRMAFCPKTPASLPTNQQVEYPMFGVPVELQLDNGREFHSLSLQVAAAELGFTLDFCPPRSPHFKSLVERFFGTVNTNLLSPAVGRVHKEEATKVRPGERVMTYAEFEELFLKWVVGVYHQQPGKPDGYSPAQRWNDSVSKHGNHQPYAVDIITKVLAISDRRDLRPGGIQFMNIQYNSPVLSTLRRELIGCRKKGTVSVEMKYDPADLGRIWVHHSGKNIFIPVPTTQPELYDGCSLWKHKIVLNEIKARKNSGQRDPKYLSAKQAINEFLDSAMIRSRSRRSSSALAAHARASERTTFRSDVTYTEAIATRPPKATHVPTADEYGRPTPERLDPLESSSPESATFRRKADERRSSPDRNEPMKPPTRKDFNFDL